MGVEFLTCPVCEYNFPDCGDFRSCDCGAQFCSADCGKIDYSENENGTCIYCRKEDIPNAKLLASLLKHYGLTREEAVKIHFAHDDMGHKWDLGWEESNKPHPGFGGSTNIYGAYVDQCNKCGMYGYEFRSCTETPGKYEGKPCGSKIR